MLKVASLNTASPSKTVLGSSRMDKSADSLKVTSLKVTSLKFASWVNWVPLKVAFPPKVVFVSPWVEKLASPLKVTSLKFAPWVNLTPLKAASLIKVDSLKSA